MDLFGLLQHGDAAKTNESSSGFGSDPERMRDLMWSTLSLERPRVCVSGEERYMTRLWVFGINGFKTTAENIVGSHEEVKDKIHKTLMLLTFREPRILIQFWAPLSVGKNKLLTTVDQPFGLGIPDEGLCYYRKESERNMVPVNEESKEDFSPLARVFRQEQPEWTPDVTNYLPKDHTLRDYAIRWNLHGCLVLPVFDSYTRSCVGVLELVMSSKYLDYAYEVQEVHRSLKVANLTSPQAFDYPTSYVNDESRKHELDEIFRVLKDLCDTHKLPLAQTWKMSSLSSFVAIEGSIEKSCSSFNTSCIGKMCMSTTGLPFYARNLGLWPFREVSRKRHLQKSKGVVGRALSSLGSCFCEDVTKLGEDEYSLVHNARMCGLTSCFAIYLHSTQHDDDYVLEFFLTFDMKEDGDVQNLVQKLKVHVMLSSLFELGDIVNIEVVGMPMEISKPSLSMQHDIISTFHTTREAVKLDSKEAEIAGENNSQIDCINISNQYDSSKGYPNNCDIAITTTKEMDVDNVTLKKNDAVAVEKWYNSRERVSSTKSRKSKRGSFTLEDIQQCFGKPIGEASMSLGVSRSTLKRVCRELGIPRWPLSHHNKKNAHVPNIKLPHESSSDNDLEKSSTSSVVRLGVLGFVLLVVRTKRWSCSSNHHEFLARWWICGKHSGFLSQSKLSLDSYDSTMMENPSFIPPLYKPRCPPACSSQQLKESNESIATLISSSKALKKPFGFVEAAFFLLCWTRWRNRSLSLRREYLAVCESIERPKHTTNIVVENAYSHPSIMDMQISDTRDMFQASAKCSVGNVSDIPPSFLETKATEMATLKAIFKDDMIKFQFPLSSKLLELKSQVAERFKLKSKSVCLKYMDEDNDLILIACDADLHKLLGSLVTSSSKSNIKLMVKLHDD